MAGLYFVSYSFLMRCSSVGGGTFTCVKSGTPPPSAFICTRSRIVGSRHWSASPYAKKAYARTRFCGVIVKFPWAVRMVSGGKWLLMLVACALIIPAIWEQKPFFPLASLLSQYTGLPDGFT